MTQQAQTELDRIYAEGIENPERRDDFFVFTARHFFYIPLYEEGSTDCLALPRPEDETRVFFPFFDTEERMKELLGDDAPFHRMTGADFFAPMKSGAVAVLNPHIEKHIVFSKPDMDIVVQIAQALRFAKEQGVESLVEFKQGRAQGAAFRAALAQLTDRHAADIEGIWLKEVCTRNAQTGYIEGRRAAVIITARNEAMKDAIETAAHSFFSVLGDDALPMIFMSSPGDNFSRLTEQSAPDWPARQ
ncbi:MAG: hypothetical protein GC185_12155 [Alphaproteobacteria bacterium]|nr:hypothetical protein [Alphaproteobacteria bacterium]